VIKFSSYLPRYLAVTSANHMTGPSEFAFDRILDIEIRKILAQVLGGKLSVDQRGHLIRSTLSDEDRGPQLVYQPKQQQPKITETTLESEQQPHSSRRGERKKSVQGFSRSSDLDFCYFSFFKVLLGR
jgi:hypothetical protein